MTDLDLADLIRRHHMKTEHIVDFRILHASRLDHAVGTSDRLLRRLEEDFHTSAPLVLMLLEKFYRSERNRHVCIMTARMHDSRILRAVGSRWVFI